MVIDGSEINVPEDIRRLTLVEHENRAIDVALVVESLRRDQVVLIRNLNGEQADRVMSDTASGLGLSGALELQAGFAGFLGHRHNIGKYFMSVNKRDNYQFVTPHSEGTSFIGMQIAAFFCFENSTDGGETILMNVDSSGNVWGSLREKIRKAKIGVSPLAPRQISRIRGLYQLDPRTDILRDDDQILQEHHTDITDLIIVEVLARPKKTHSCILDEMVYAYWDSVGGIDFDSAREFERLLRQAKLLKEPHEGIHLHEMDNSAGRRVWHSKVNYSDLFKCKITRKLAPGDLIIQNNMTWTHAVSNWSPGSGTRKVAASFA